MEKPDYDVGDLVVCVDDGPIQCHRGVHTGEGLVIGRCYRVSAFTTTGKNPRHRCGTLLAAFADGHLGVTSRFRKIDRADDEFIALIRATKPSLVPA